MCHCFGEMLWTRAQPCVGFSRAQAFLCLDSELDAGATEARRNTAKSSALQD